MPTLAKSVSVDNDDSLLGGSATPKGLVGFQTLTTKDNLGLGRAERLFQKAVTLETNNFQERSIQLYKKLWDNFPQYSRRHDILYRWAKCLEVLGDKKQAHEKLTLLETLYPNYPGLQEALTRTQ